MNLTVAQAPKSQILGTNFAIPSWLFNSLYIILCHKDCSLCITKRQDLALNSYHTIKIRFDNLRLQKKVIEIDFFYFQ